MNNYLSESELLLNPDGSIYHLNLLPEELADTVILVGDPGRVPLISKHFDSIEVKKQKREIVTHTGYCNKKRLTVMSTGMGVGCIDIVMVELDALANVDLKKRAIKQQIKKLNLVRFGTSGALQADIPLNSVVVSSHGVGLDLLLHYYAYQPTPDETNLTQAFKKHLAEYSEQINPYIRKGAEDLIGLFSGKAILGMTATGVGFYAPQGRQIRFKCAMPDLIDRLVTFNHQGRRITNFEMETSAIYGLGHGVLGHNTCSINLIIANRALKSASDRMYEAMEDMIKMGLETLTTSNITHG